MLKATHKKWVAVVGYQEVPLEPGQFIFGRKKASEETRLSERTIRTCVKNLVNIGNLTIKTTNTYSVITICNWGVYKTDKYKNDQQSDQPVTSERPTNDQPVTTYKNLKNKKNNNNGKSAFETPVCINCKYIEADDEGFICKHPKHLNKRLKEYLDKACGDHEYKEDL